MPVNRKGKNNPNYKSGRSKDSNGYYTVPFGDADGKRKYEHRVKTGAGKGEAVHHRDHDRDNNDAKNLKHKSDYVPLEFSHYLPRLR